MATTSESKMKTEEQQTITTEQPHKRETEDSPLSAQSSPPHSLHDHKNPSPPAHSLSNSTDFSDHTCHSHGHSSIDDSLAVEPPENFPASPLPLAANRAQPTEPIVVTKKDAEIQGVRTVEEGSDVDLEGGGSGGNGGAVGRSRKLMENLSFKRLKRENSRKKGLLGFRICGFAFCLVSFSVMAANKNQGWALDSFYRYKEFRYCMAVNVLGFVYSAIQCYDLVYFLTTGKHMIRHQFKQYFDFFIDQIVAYLLLSASSSAATRVDDWQSNWGKDKFPDMAAASVGLSIIAFVAFALSCLISGYTLCKSA